MRQNNKKILILVDHKHRDFPSLSLMAYFLNHMGSEAKLAAIGQYDDIIKLFDPGYIVLPKPNHDFEKVMSWRLKGRKIIIIDSEGNNQDKEFIYNIRVKPDAYLFWNDIEKNKYLFLSNTYNTKLKTLGYYRSDFLYPPLHDLYGSRKNILHKLSLDHSQPTVTIATAFQETHLSEERKKRKEVRRKNSLIATDYRTLIDNDQKLRDLTENVIKLILNKYPNLNLVIKPHPHENVVYWNEFIKGINNNNLKLLVGKSINTLFQISDFHIAKNVCTTTIESRLYGIKSLELHTENSIEIFPKKHFLSNYIATNTDEAMSVIDSVLFNKNNNKADAFKNNNDVNDYSEKHLYKFDGLRCFEYARYLEELTKGKLSFGTKISFRNFFYDLKNIGLYVIAFLRNRLSYKLYKQSKIDYQVNNVSSNDVRQTSEINDVLIDMEFGLFDNRIKEGDELLWFKKFDMNKHIQDLIKSL
jgi:surface carbohydrate biosynthesis protein